MTDEKVKTPVRRATVAPAGFVLEKFLDQGDGTHARAVAVVGADGPLELTGDVVLDSFGAVDDAKETDPDAASATIPALLRGLLATHELYAQRLADAISTISPNAALQAVVLDDDGSHVIGRANESPATDPTASPLTVTSLLRGLLATHQLYAQSLADTISTISPASAVKVVALDDDGNHVLGKTNESPTLDPDASPASITSLLRGILHAVNQIAINTAP